MNKRETVVATINFYEANMEGVFDNEPSVYEVRGNGLEEAKKLLWETLWQATEIEGYDDSEVLVEAQFERDGEYLDREEFYMCPVVVRTVEPSEYIIWGDKKPHIFKIDRALSNLYVSGV